METSQLTAAAGLDGAPAPASGMGVPLLHLGYYPDSLLGGMRQLTLFCLVLAALCRMASGTPCTLLDVWVGADRPGPDAGALLADMAELHRAGAIEGWAVLQALAPLVRQAHTRLNCSAVNKRATRPSVDGYDPTSLATGRGMTAGHRLDADGDSELSWSSHPLHWKMAAERVVDGGSVVAVSLVSGPYQLHTDCEALVDLNLHTLNTSFTDPSCLQECCSCREVNCSNAGRVTHLSVSPAAGTIPASIWALESLETLRVVGREYGAMTDEQLLMYVVQSAPQSTAVAGILSFPPMLPANLTDLIVYGSFEGEILFAAKPLMKLQLAGLFTGAVPTAAMQVTANSVQVVGSFTSPLPAIPFLQSLRFLSVEGATGGNLSEWTTFPPALAVLDMSLNQLTGEIPPSLEMLANLTDLSLSSNLLHGCVPAFFGRLKNLAFLALNANLLSGSIPEALGNATSLWFVDLTSNQLTGSIPASLGNLKALTQLWLASNQLSGGIPPSLSQLEDLGVLVLCSNKLTGGVPDWLGEMENLTVLYLCLNQLTGGIPASMGNMQSLTELFMHSNQLSESIPPSLGDLPNLVSLDLSSNLLIGIIPPSLGNLTGLTSLSLYSNQLTGSIPASLGNLSKLESLNLGSNMLGGELPAELCSLTRLQKLDLHDNALDGAIPEHLCFMPALITLSLSQNNISLFPNCSNPPFWTSVDVSANSLQAFPVADALLWPSLVALDVSHNRLSGDFPVIPVNTTVRTLSLAFNNLRGNFPIGPCGSFEAAYYTSPTRGLSYLDVSGNNVTGFFFTDRHNDGCNVFCNNSYDTLSSLLMSGCSLSSFAIDWSSRCSILHTPIAKFLALFPSLQSIDLSGNNVGGILDQLFSIAPLASLDLRGNPATLEDSLSFSLRQDVHFDPGSLFPYSAGMTCYQALFGANLRMKVDPTFFDYANCQCRTGYYGKPPDCRACTGSLAQASCSFALDVNVSSLATNVSLQKSGNVLAQQGYYASPSVSYEDQMRNLSYPKAIELCRGSVPTLSSCSATEDGPCVPGYNGRLCSRCAGGYFASGEKCWQCPSTAGLAAFGAIILLALVGFIVWSFFLGGSGSGLFKIFLFFLQGIAYTKAPMPDALYVILSTGSSLSIFPVVGPECFFSSWKFTTQYTIAACSPVIIGLLCLAVWTVGCLLRNAWDDKPWLDRCLRSAVFLLVATYMFVTTNIIIPLSCEQDPGDLDEYFVFLPYHKCSAGLRISSALLLVGYVVGGPASLAWFIFNSRAVQDRRRHPRARFVFSLLFASYRPGMQFWELVAVLRRILFVVAFMLPAFSACSGLLLCVVLGASAILQAHLHPYCHSLENTLEMVSFLLLLTNYVVRLEGQVLGTVDIDAVGAILFAANLLFVVVVCCILLRKAVHRMTWRPPAVGRKFPCEAEDQLLPNDGL